MAEGHFTPKNLVHLWQKSFRFQEKSIKNPYESFCSEKISYAFPISELPLGYGSFSSNSNFCVFENPAKNL